MKADEPSADRELYALLHISPEASDEEIRKAYRQWAQVYHPDKYQSPQMKDIATENFQRIRDAYEILSDEQKRQIYDIYGLEGLNSGLELGPRLSKPEEIKEELERLRRRKEEDKLAAHVRPSGSLLANLSWPQYRHGGGIVRGMAMASQVQSQISKRNSVAIGGNLVVSGDSGSGTASAVLRHQLSPVSSIEFMATAGLRTVIGIQTTRNLSLHSTGTSGLAINLKDGTVNLTNSWTRQLSETAAGNIQLVLGAESTISVGWQKKDEKNSAAGELKFGTSAFGASGHYTRRFSSKSHGRVAARIGSTDLEFEVGGGRRISEFSTVRMLYTLGIRGISWRFELHRGGQKLVIPILLATHFDFVYAAGALMIPSSLYFVLKERSLLFSSCSWFQETRSIPDEAIMIKGCCKYDNNGPEKSFAKIMKRALVLIKKFVFKPYYLRREKRKALEKIEQSSTQIQEAKAASEKAQQLLLNVSNRKKNKQMEIGGLVIGKAIYGNSKALKRRNGHTESNDEVGSQIVDVTIPLNFLVNDLGQLKLHEGIKKSGIMGFYDPCPGESKLLYVEYSYQGQDFEVFVDDYGELLIPHEAHRS